MTTAIRCLVAAIVLPSAATAQVHPLLAEETARAAMLLKSPRLADRAWGAHFAGRLRLASLADSLIQELRRFPSPVSPDETAYAQSLLDALIELDAVVDAGVIAPHRASWSAETLILLSRAPSEELLLAMREEPMSNATWLGVNNLLLGMRSVEFVARTLRELKFTHRLLVFSEGSGGGFGGGVMLCSMGSCGPRRHVDGFPPTDGHTITTAPRPGDRLLVDGPRPVYRRRTMSGCESDGSRDRQPYRVEYLAKLAGVELAEARNIVERTSTVTWRGAEHFAAEARALLDQQAIGLRGLKARIERKWHVDVSRVRLIIAAEVMDMREEPRVEPAPPIAPLEVDYTTTGTRPDSSIR